MTIIKRYPNRKLYSTEAKQYITLEGIADLIRHGEEVQVVDQAGGETMGTLRRTLASPLNLARQVDDEIERRLQALVSRGELAAEEGRRLRQKLLGQGTEVPGAPRLSEQELERLLEERGVPSRQDLQQVLDQLEILAIKLDEMAPDGESA
jgi:polyhydroxyalkanoate synthesis regulator phasin